jgi:hypothetical protein
MPIVICSRDARTINTYSYRERWFNHNGIKKIIARRPRFHGPGQILQKQESPFLGLPRPPHLLRAFKFLRKLLPSRPRSRLSYQVSDWPAICSNLRRGDFSGEMSAFTGTIRVCSKARRPDKTACGTASVKASQVDEGGKSARILVPSR